MTENAQTVGIIGAGTMGAGIAQVACAAGWTVELMDVDESTVQAAIHGVRCRLDRLVEKGRMTDEQRRLAADRLLAATSPHCLSGCELIIEAVVEDMDAKARVLSAVLESLRGDAIVATNTSSLSVTGLGRAIGQARRTVGMHFFNPAPLMRLVEIVAGADTDPEVADRAAAVARSWGKQVARAADVPGFIVNHVARPYYLEAFRILEDGCAAADEIDEALRTLGGFRMGPLELTDLIGQDVNTATTRSVWAALGHPPLLAPCRAQEQLVRDGHLGRKTGRGVYRYDVDPPVPALTPPRRPPPVTPELRDAVAAFVEAAGGGRGDETMQYVFARVLAAVIVQAAEACRRGVAEPADIDVAMRFGANYPDGPFSWASRIGPATCRRLMAALNDTVEDDRFAPVELPETG